MRRTPTLPHLSLMSAFSRPWAITPTGLDSLRGMIDAGVVQSLQAYASQHDPRRIEARRSHASAMIWEEDEDWFDPLNDPHIRPSGIGVFPIRGPLFDRAWACFAGYDRIIETCREFEAHYLIRKELQDVPDLAAIVMPFDTPGGMVSGWSDACAAVRRLREIVPVYSVADREACSAGEGLASSATKSFCTNDSLRGSCGAKMTHVDYSRHLAEEGEDVRHFTSARYKDVGAGDVPRSPETIETFTAFTERSNEIFREIMLAGRGMSRADFDRLEARIFWGPDAIEAGLCDKVLTFSQIMEILETGGQI